MIRFLTALIAALIAAPLAAQPTVQPAPQLSLEHRMLLRCSAAFALVATRQAEGDPDALVYPPLRERGAEFFVRASARVMDEARLDRTQIAQALTAEARTLAQPGALAPMMPACLGALDAAGL